MYSLHYGTIPIVRGTGGLDDSVIDLGEDLERANGIKFYECSIRALAKAIRKAELNITNIVRICQLCGRPRAHPKFCSGGLSAGNRNSFCTIGTGFWD